MTLTTLSGKKVEFAEKAIDMMASANGITFAVVKTDGGCASRFLVREVGNRRIEMTFGEQDLAQLHAAFDRFLARISAEVDEDLAYYERSLFIASDGGMA